MRILKRIDKIIIVKSQQKTRNQTEEIFSKEKKSSPYPNTRALLICFGVVSDLMIARCDVDGAVSSF